MFGFGPGATPGGAPASAAGYNYQALFTSFGPQQTPTGPQLVGTQIFSFFNTSGLPKGNLAEIWKEATYGQPGGLDVNKFVNAMKLISLAQKGQSPTMATLQQNPAVEPPKLAYPPGMQPAAATGGGGGGGGGAFADLLSGFKPGGGSGGALGLGPGPAAPSKPSGPTWGPDTTAAAAPAATPSVPAGPVGNGIAPAGPIGVSGPIVGGPMAPPHVRQNSTYMSGNYGPPSSLLTRQSSLNVIKGDTAASSPAAEGRRGSSSWTDERLREQVRAAELRESQARKQANEARITNERLERENEALQREIREARDAQSTAMKQNQEALNAITPLRTENEQLKVALGQWKVLVEQKDAALDQYEQQVNALNAQLKEAENEFNHERQDYNDLKFELENYKTRCEESESRLENSERRCRQFEKERNEIELEKHKLGLDNISLKREIADLKREVDALKKKPTESSLVGSFGPPVSKPTGPSFAPSSTTSFPGSDDFTSFSPPPSQGGSKFSPPTSTTPNFGPPATASGGFGPPGFDPPSQPNSQPMASPIQPVAPSQPAAPAQPVQPVVQPSPSPQPKPQPKPVESKPVPADDFGSWGMDSGPSTAAAAAPPSGGKQDDFFGGMDFPDFGSDPAPVQPKPQPVQPKPQPVQPAAPMFPAPEEKAAPVQPKPQPKPQPQPQPAQPAQEPGYYIQFAMTDDEKNQYIGFFERANVSGSGRLNHSEAINFCRQSQLDDPTLEKLWKIVNMNNEMTPSQFAVMFHMCLKIKIGAGGVQAPPTLPRSLIPFVMEGMPKKDPTPPVAAPTAAPTATPGGDDEWAQFDMGGDGADLFPEW